MNLLPGSAIPYLTVGGRVFTDLKNLVVVTGGFDGTNTNSSCREWNGSAGYQVPVGKRLVIFAAQVNCIIFTTTCFYTICYSDNDVGVYGTTAFTNKVTLGNSASSIAYMPIVSAVGKTEQAGVLGIVPAQKYVGLCKNIGDAYTLVTLFGYLEAV
jgi:hypothetical protein